MSRPRTRAYLIAAAAAAVLAAGAAVAVAHDRAPDPVAGQWVAPAAAALRPSPTASAKPLPAAKPPAGLPVIEYASGPSGLPADPEQNSTVAPTRALHPTTRIALYDAPGGKPRAYLPPDISGLRTVVPIVEQRDGWVAVLVPSVNRRIGWVPVGSGETVTLRDQLVAQLSEHALIWLRDGQEQQRWTVATGSKATPTPVGRTYVMGTTPLKGDIYLNMGALVLGSVPEQPEKMAAVFQLAHTGIHAWYNKSAFGHSVSNGCLRMPKAAQQKLLDEIPPGTTLTVLS
ncbi:spore protein [Actinoplanes sp. SE50]|uniref:L,D-transpeptidase n=1 Tax=unclassified Actinoplanes TaxID=2626549 RepID=UPI00023ED032|nr:MULTISPECIES: L,D-transpeptidase [unclassified Actinoplanes]AEV83304.1 YkuD-like spore protein [Actinoplanes sp. SE50/110]ATO81697.1 spore protein [Actinoplanes sp. SE50]SLL99105.1 spore protein [Actinoplanes sp. SE50/110]